MNKDLEKVTVSAEESTDKKTLELYLNGGLVSEIIPENSIFLSLIICCIFSSFLY